MSENVKRTQIDKEIEEARLVRDKATGEAITTLIKKIEGNVSSTEALQFTQAALNLAHMQNSAIEGHLRLVEALSRPHWPWPDRLDDLITILEKAAYTQPSGFREGGQPDTVVTLPQTELMTWVEDLKRLKKNQ